MKILLLLSMASLTVIKAIHLDKRALPPLEISDAERIEMEEHLDHFAADNPDEVGIMQPNRFNYEVSLEKYYRRYCEKENTEKDGKKLRKIWYKYDMLLRNSATEIMMHSHKHGKVATQLFADFTALQMKARKALQKAQGYRKLAEKLHDGEEVSNETARILYSNALRRVNKPEMIAQIAQQYGADALQDFMELLESDKMLLEDKEEKSTFKSIKRIAATYGKDSKMEARLAQFKAAYLANARHGYFDLIDSRKKAALLKEEMKQFRLGVSEKTQRELRKCSLKELAVADKHIMSAYELYQMYTASAERHEAAIQPNWDKYELSSAKRDTWRQRAFQGIRHLPPSTDQHGLAHDSEDNISETDRET